MPREVTRMDLESVFTREDNPNQVRELNYVLSYDTIDPETGEMIDSNEYRTVASDIPLSLDRVKELLTTKIEGEYGR